MTTATEWASVKPREYLGPHYRYHWMRRFCHASTGASVQLCKQCDQTISLVVWLADGRFKSIGTLPVGGALHCMVAEAMYTPYGEWGPVLDALQDAYDLWGDDCGTYVPQHDWTSPVRLEIG